jgi:hypothetical protein
MLRLFRASKRLLLLAICVYSCGLTGCIESSFNLANESRLPKYSTLPPGLTRSDVSVTVNLYTPLLGPDTKFEIRDAKKKKAGTGKRQIEETHQAILL